MDNIDGYALKFVFSDKVGTFFITMMGALRHQSSSRLITSEGGKLFVEQRNPDEVINFNFDLDRMGRLLGSWLDMRDPTIIVSLNWEETELFKKCADAAYYFITEEFNNAALAENYVQVYQSFFGKS